MDLPAKFPRVLEISLVLRTTPLLTSHAAYGETSGFRLVRRVEMSALIDSSFNPSKTGQEKNTMSNIPLQLNKNASLHVEEHNGSYRQAHGDEVVAAAKLVLNRRFRRGVSITSPAATEEFLQMKFANLEHEVFAIIWLDTRHRVISFDEIFRGTIDGASVYPRECVKIGLQHNAAACILAHNHPSGISEPSLADQAITRRLKDAFALVDIRVLDHLVVGDDVVSFASRGLL